ncbi:methionyl-tRNA formyltransferase [Alicyclobacillus hesperidum subsp. aegles]|uniref:methionyl-tRNA formyltransferase n=1 Tax=Alicyclobacillus hesperidum TaxID=89784 RepID=UPI0022295E99|nr:methionyl-tRNA formyltransferase [Alicyclobacillus hesperidum]GLG01071.1 methionyl-tRNA formyltransferase [Alicyclobacillus hesperidum subsp. aegles]
MSVRALFMGTPDFALPALEALVRLSWEVCVVTQPDRPAGRKRLLTPPPVKRRALELGLRVLQPEKVGHPDSVRALSEWDADILVTAAYGQLLPDRVLKLAKSGAVNVHASLLPRWRGAAPIQRAILAGDTKTGVTLMEMVRELDAGPMIAQQELPIGPDTTAGELHDKLAALGGQMCAEILPAYVRGELQAIPQPAVGVTYAEKLTRSDEWIDWRLAADAIALRVRALAPWPGASAIAPDGRQLKILRGHVGDGHLSGEPGLARRLGDTAVVACGNGVYVVEQVQPAGKRPMSAGAWLAGLRTDTVVFERIDTSDLSS